MTISRRLILSAASALVLSGCGFHLRGSFTLPFKTLYVDMDENSAFRARLVRLLTAGSSVKVVNSATDAEAILKVTSMSQSRDVLSYNTKGDAAEYELTLKVAFKVSAPDGREYVPESVISAVRSVSYSDDEYLSRQNSEALVYQEMQSDAANQMLRRVEAAKPLKAAAE